MFHTWRHGQRPARVEDYVTHVARVVVLLVLTAALAGCAQPPPPPRTYTAWLSSPGGAVTWRFQVDGAYADQGSLRPMSSADAYVDLPVREGQRVTLSAAIEGAGFAGCRIVRDDGVEVVPRQLQELQVPRVTGVKPPAECTFIG